MSSCRLDETRLRPAHKFFTPGIEYDEYDQVMILCRA